MTEEVPLIPRTLAPAGALPSFAETFDRDGVTELRHAVATYAESAGLTGQRLDDFVLAANELITNAVRHGGGRGRLRLWRDDAAVRCEVSDAGAGISPDRLTDPHRPAPTTAGGWGLWLAQQLSDEMVVRTGEAGTTVQISTAIAEPVELAPEREAHGPAVPAGDN